MATAARESKRSWTFRPILLAAVLPIPAVAESVTVGPVTFDLPPGLSRTTGRPAPIVASWRGDSDPLSVDVFVIGLPPDGVAAAIKESADWPGVGRSMAASLGEATSTSMEQIVRAPCSYTGAPVANDAARSVSRIVIEVTCATSPDPTVIRSLAVAALTRSGHVLVRVDAQRAAFTAAGAVADAVFNSLQVVPEYRLSAVGRGVESADYAPVAGGAGIRLTDYSLIRSGAIWGFIAGAIVGTLAFGALLAAGFIRVGMRPVAALVAAQALLFVLGVWGDKRGEVWEIDWLRRGFPGLLAVFILRGWAGRFYSRRVGVVAPPLAAAPAERQNNREADGG